MSPLEPTADLHQPDGPSRTSASLLDRAKARDPDAWRKLVDLYAPFVYTWCRRWGVEPGDARDLVQEVFQAVAVHLARFRHDQPGATFRGWMWTIAHNAARKYFIARGKRPEVIGGTDMHLRLGQVPAASAAQDETAEDAPPPGEDVLCMRRALEMIRGDFQPQTWQAFWRNAIDGQPPGEVARELGLTKAAVRQARYRVFVRLREQFGQLID